MRKQPAKAKSEDSPAYISTTAHACMICLCAWAGSHRRMVMRSAIYAPIESNALQIRDGQ